MKICSNELWIIQEERPFCIQFQSRNREGKLVVVYDFISQFILYAQFYFLPERKITMLDIFAVLHNYGIPEHIVIPEKSFFGGTTENVKDLLGIQIWEWDKTETGEKIKEMVHEFDVAWNSKMESVKKESQDLSQFQNNMKRLIAQWNYDSPRAGSGNSPAEQYHENLGEHIFYDNERLLECGLRKYKGIVSSNGNIQVLNRIYQVPAEYYGKIIEFYISPFEKKEIYIYDEDRTHLLYCCPFVREIDV